LLCARVLGPDAALPSVAELKHRAGWWRLRWLLLGCVLIGITGIYYLAFLLALLAICAVVSALAQRRPGRMVTAAIFGAAALGASVLANLPTLLYRWQHVANILTVPDRDPGVAEAYPLRLVELLSPVTAHRFGPFAALADHLYEPGRQGLGTAELGLAAAIGFACAVVAVLVRAVRSADRRGWSLEARLGIVMVGALLLGTKGGISRALELVGLQGVRAWNRIAIVIAFAAIAVFARLLDRLRVVLHRRQQSLPRFAWASLLAVVVVVGVLDQASPAAMPHPKAIASAWHSDGAFVASMERQLPRDAMVFQLPVDDFPDHSAIQDMSAYDEIKEGYLHSKTLRWSAGGVRGRDGEWQWPASALPPRDLVRGVMAMGFSALTLDRFGFAHNGTTELRELEGLLGKPIATEGDRLVAWDLRPATVSLLGDLDTAGRQALVQQLLDAPRVYLSSDADPITDRGDPHEICASASLTLVNPGPRVARQHLDITFRQRQSAARDARVTIERRTVALSFGRHGTSVRVDLPPGASKMTISIQTPGVRCASTPPAQLATVSVGLADH